MPNASLPSSATSVCRQFYEKFPVGRSREAQELVTFIVNHPSSRKKIQGWIQSEEGGGRGPFPISSTDATSVHDDYGQQRSAEPLSATSPHVTHEETNTISRSSVFTKSNVLSNRSREFGNECFKKKKLLDSLHHYNEAIKLACFPVLKSEAESRRNDDEEDDSTLAMAFANRSAVYAELGLPFYDKAVQDVNYALKYGYPERLKVKLVVRKADIYAKQRNVDGAQKCLEIIKACTNNSTLQISPILESKIAEVEICISRLLELEQTPSQTSRPRPTSTKDVHNIFLREDCYVENDKFENASEKICIRTGERGDVETELLGRYVVALSDLNEGETLFVEKPFASVLLPEFDSSYCHHCHKLLRERDTSEILYFYPCRRCTRVYFCDHLCSDAAEGYHQHECGWLGFLQSVGIAHLAIRTILVAGVESVLKCTKVRSVVSDTTNLDLFMKGRNNYDRVYSLLDHLSDMYEEDLFQYTLTAGLLTTFLLTKTSFLTGIGEKDSMRIGGTLLRHICQLICNAHAITDILSDPMSSNSVVVDESQKRVATAIYPAASIMNHSCDSNISFRFTDGRTLVVKAARKIGRCEDVFNCYGPHYRRMPRAERQDILRQQYMFNCTCRMCKKEMKLGHSFADQFNAFRCDQCTQPINLPERISLDFITPCLSCGEKQNMKPKVSALEVLRDLQKKGEYLLDRGDYEEATETFESCYTTAAQVFYKYNSKFGQICDTLARCYLSTGKPDKANKFAKQSLEYVAARFGETSHEYTHELQKYDGLFLTE